MIQPRIIGTQRDLWDFFIATNVYRETTETRGPSNTLKGRNLTFLDLVKP